jgi:hypothetical protein
MRGHLTDREMAAHAAGTLAGEGLAHLMSCAACLEERAQLRAGLVELACHIHAEAERSEAFFQSQRAKIAHRLRERRPSVRRWRWAWAPALAATALLALFLAPGGPPVQRLEDPEADRAFLRAVQQSIQAEVPEALRPAALLLGEVERGVLRPDRKIIAPKGDPP